MRIGTMVLALMMTGCNSAPGALEGVWLLNVTPALTQNCETTVTENYTDGTPKDDADSGLFWEYTNDGSMSPSSGFARITKGADGGRVMVFNGAVMLGTKEGKVWTFTSTGNTNATSAVNHVSDAYEFSIAQVADSVQTMAFTLAGKRFEGGTWSSQTTNDTTYTETDEWNPDTVPLLAGQTPSTTYLETNLGQPYVNRPTDRDCGGDACSLQVVEVCDSSNTLDGEWTNLDGDDAFDGVNFSGNPAGYNP
jgi:hypothetical protein